VPRAVLARGAPFWTMTRWPGRRNLAAPSSTCTSKMPPRPALWGC